MDRGAWQATVRGVAKSWTRLRDCNALTETGTRGSRSQVQLAAATVWARPQRYALPLGYVHLVRCEPCPSSLLGWQPPATGLLSHLLESLLWPVYPGRISWLVLLSPRYTSDKLLGALCGYMNSQNRTS